MYTNRLWKIWNNTNLNDLKSCYSNYANANTYLKRFNTILKKKSFKRQLHSQAPVLAIVGLLLWFTLDIGRYPSTRKFSTPTQAPASHMLLYHRLGLLQVLEKFPGQVLVHPFSCHATGLALFGSHIGMTPINAKQARLSFYSIEL